MLRPRFTALGCKVGFSFDGPSFFGGLFPRVPNRDQAIPLPDSMISLPGGLRMIRRIKLVQFGAVSLVAVRILCCPGILMAQESNTDPEPRIVEPIITEETMPNEPGEWDLRLSGSYMWQGPGGF